MSAHRKRLRRIEAPGHVRFLTFSCSRRLPLFQNDAIKDAFVETLRAARDRDGFLLLGWVIMPEHVHLMIQPNHDVADVPKILWGLKKPFAQRILNRWRELDAPVLTRLHHEGTQRFWQVGGGYDRNIVSTDEYFEKLGYMHANPVTRGLVDVETDYPWSSAVWYAGKQDEALIDIDPG